MQFILNPGSIRVNNCSGNNNFAPLEVSVNMKSENFDISEYQYDLPDERIAKFPLKRRDQSKLLIWNKGKISHDIFSRLTHHLPAKSLLMFNNTRVIPARLRFRRKTGAVIEIFLLEPLRPSTEWEKVMQSEGTCTWRCLVGHKKRWKEGEVLEKETGGDKDPSFRLQAIFENRENNEVRFTWSAGHRFAKVIESAGLTPIPPYLNRETVPEDRQRYQTIYSEKEGAVAAPTAGLHFTLETFANLKRKGIKTDFITLHVSAGTFKPVKTTDYREHPMHAEQIVITLENIRALLEHKNEIIAVGTTSMRSLESLYWYGVRLMTGKGTSFHIEKLFPYHFDDFNLPDKREVFEYLIRYMNEKRTDRLQGETEIFIFPGYKFKVCNGLITNFHMPGSTLLLLIAAFTKGKWKEIYREALEKDYRFLSYGDSSLILG